MISQQVGGSYFLETRNITASYPRGLEVHPLFIPCIGIVSCLSRAAIIVPLGMTTWPRLWLSRRLEQSVKDCVLYFLNRHTVWRPHQLANQSPHPESTEVYGMSWSGQHLQLEGVKALVNPYSLCWATLFSIRSSALEMELSIQCYKWQSRTTTWASNLWTHARGISNTFFCFCPFICNTFQTIIFIFFLILLRHGPYSYIYTTLEHKKELSTVKNKTKLENTTILIKKIKPIAG